MCSQQRIVSDVCTDVEERVDSSYYVEEDAGVFKILGLLPIEQLRQIACLIRNESNWAPFDVYRHAPGGGKHDMFGQQWVQESVDVAKYAINLRLVDRPIYELLHYCC
jgi:hypothetical protein